jgi:hypothetical protein
MKDRMYPTLNEFLTKQLDQKQLEKIKQSLCNLIRMLPSSITESIVNKMKMTILYESKERKNESLANQFEEMILKVSDINDMKSIISLFPKTILESPLHTIPIDHPTKSTLLHYFEEFPAFENHFSISKKQGGDNPSGLAGGIKGRLYENDGIVYLQTMLVKQGLSIRETIAEQFLSQVGIAIAEDIEGVKDIIASVYFTRDLKAEDKSKNLYIASIYLDHFTDVANLIGVKRGKGMWGGQKTPEEQKEKLLKAIDQADQAKIYKRTLGEIFAISLLFGNKQVHWNNIGVSSYFDGEKEVKKFSAIDLGGMGRREFKLLGGEESGQFGMDVKLDPYHMKRYANYFESYPDQLRQDSDFIEGFMKVVNYSGEKLKKIIDDTIDKIVDFCTIEEIQIFANELDTENRFIKKYKNENDKVRYINDIKDFMFKTIYARQVSLKQISIDWAKNKKFDELVNHHPIYFLYKDSASSLNEKSKKDILSKIGSLFIHYTKTLKTEDANHFNHYFASLLERSKYETVDHLILHACDKAFHLFSPLPFSLDDISRMIYSPVLEKKSDVMLSLSRSQSFSSRSKLFSPSADSQSSEPFSPSDDEIQRKSRKVD